MTPSLRSFLPAASLAFALFSSASPALAEDPLPCEYPDDNSYMCFKSESVTVSKTSANIPFENGLRTGWLNCEAPSGDKTPCSQQPSFKCKTLGACLEVAMDDSKLDLAMQHTWDVYWPQAGSLQLFPRKPYKEGGTFAFTYKLTPTFSIFIDALNSKWFFSIDPTQIADILDKSGTVKEFKSSASGSCKFAPFALDNPVECPGKSTNGTVFSFNLSDIGINIDEYVKIALGLDAGTSEVVFSWKTDEISVNGSKITKDSPSATISYNGGGTINAEVATKGKLTYKGKTFLAPTIEVQEIAGLPLKFKWPIDVGADLPFEGTIPIDLNKTNFDILLPDLGVIAAVNADGAFDFGSVVVGETKSKKIKLKNYGAIKAVGIATSSAPSDFVVSKGSINLEPDEEVDIEVNFVPKKSGKISATIFIDSNDPDEPKQKVNVIGKGLMPDEPDEPERGGSGGAPLEETPSGGSAGKKPTKSAPEPEETTTDGGCGCRVADSRGPDGAAPLALLALAGIFARRRRS